MPVELPYRRTCSALLVDGDGHVLLVEDERCGETLWAAPGGRAGAAESSEAALRGALLRETGLLLADGALRDLVWVHHLPREDLRGEGVGGTSDEVYLVRVPRFDPMPGAHDGEPAPPRSAASSGPGTGRGPARAIRWWDPADMARATAEGVRFCPRDLPTRLPALLATAWTWPVPEPATIRGA